MHSIFFPIFLPEAIQRPSRLGLFKRTEDCKEICGQFSIFEIRSHVFWIHMCIHHINKCFLILFIWYFFKAFFDHLDQIDNSMQKGIQKGIHYLYLVVGYFLTPQFVLYPYSFPVLFPVLYPFCESIYFENLLVFLHSQFNR